MAFLALKRDLTHSLFSLKFALDKQTKPHLVLTKIQQIVKEMQMLPPSSKLVHWFRTKYPIFVLLGK